MPLKQYNKVFLSHAIACLAFVFSANITTAQKIKYTGQVLDYDSHHPLPGVIVEVEGERYKSITDSAGKFSLTLPINSYTLRISFIGYVKLLYPIYILDKTFEVIYLKRMPPNELQEVTVQTIKKDAAIKDLHTGNVRISPSQLKKTPLVLGEADIIRALTLQPGIITGGETVTSYYVRGGDADQNLILLDGAPLFNISHLLGFYSGINTDAVQDVTFFKAGIPAQYGSRLSSIMLINAKTGNPDSLRFSGGVGLVSGRFLINGPVIQNKLSILASARVAYPKMIMNLFPGDVAKSDAFYYDDIVKLSYTPNQNNRINFTFYNSYDKYKFPGDTSYKWKNYVGAFNWRSSISKKFLLNVLGNFSKYKSYINGLDQIYGFVLGSSIQQNEGKATLTYNVADEQRISFGGGIVHYTIEPGELNPAGDSSIVMHKKIQAENADEYSGFISFENKITNFLSTEIGARFTKYDYLGPRGVFNYEAGQPKTFESITDTVLYSKNQKIKSYDGIEPRILLRLLLNKSTSIKLSYNRTEQYLHLITNTTSVTPVDYWKLSDQYIPPENADQYAAGLFKNFSDNVFETSIEGYYKTIKNSIEYKNGADLSLNPALETQLLPAKGYAYGIELSVRKNKGILTGMSSYTYSRIFTKVLTPFVQEQVNEGAYFPGNVDRPHNLVLSCFVALGHGWTFSSNFVYTSGRPATYPDGSYIINGNIVTNYSVRNEDRLPAYHRLDIAFSYDSRRYALQRKYYNLNFSIYNVYARQNVYSVYFKREGSRIKAYQLSVIGTLIPSISWSFNF